MAQFFMLSKCCNFSLWQSPWWLCLNQQTAASRLEHYSWLHQGLVTITWHYKIMTETYTLCVTLLLRCSLGLLHYRELLSNILGLCFAPSGALHTFPEFMALFLLPAGLVGLYSFVCTQAETWSLFSQWRNVMLVVSVFSVIHVHCFFYFLRAEPCFYITHQCLKLKEQQCCKWGFIYDH